MLRLAFAVVVAFVGLGRAAPSRACSVVGTTPHQVDPGAAAVDRQAPVLSGATVTEIRRGEASGNGCTGSVSSCAGLAGLTIHPTVTDDMTPIQELGYRITLVTGSLPPGLELPSGVVTFYAPHGDFNQSWFEDPDDQEAFDATLQLVAVDLAGNESAPQTLRAQHEGSGWGCRVVGSRIPRGASSGAAFVLALLLGYALRGRRPRAGG